MKPLDLLDPEDPRGIALPGMVIVDPDGTEVYRYRGRDFAVPEDLRGYFRPQDFGAYFRGNMFGAIAIGGRLDDKASRSIAREHRLMSQGNLEAFEAWKSNIAT